MRRLSPGLRTVLPTPWHSVCLEAPSPRDYRLRELYPHQGAEALPGRVRLGRGQRIERISRTMPTSGKVAV